MAIATALSQRGDTFPYTPASAVAGGEPVQIDDDRAGIVQSYAAASVEIGVAIVGRFDGVKTACVGSAGDPVYWDADGTSVGGDTGAYTTVASAGDFWVGTLAEAATAAMTEMLFDLNKENPVKPRFPGRTHETHAANYTVDALDVGKVLHVNTDAVVITLPASVIGYEVVVMNDAADAAALISISPDGQEIIAGPDFAGTASKDRKNTKTTAKRGDYMHVVADGSAGWYTVAMRGTWAEEA